MKRLLLLFVLFMSCKAVSQQIYIQDSFFEEALIELGYDAAYDHYVSSENINTISSLTINKPGMQSLVGIEGFTALTTLNVTANIVTLNLPQNTALTSLTYSGYSQNIDLTQNNALTYLKISGSFPNLNLSQNTALTYLSVSSFTLINLDISNLTALRELHCTSGLAIDLSTNAQLRILDLYNTNASLAQILDISHNTLLEEIKARCYAGIDFSNNHLMKKIDIFVSPMTSIDVSAMPDLNHLLINTAMNLPTLDVSHNPLLATLSIAGTGVQTLTMPPGSTFLKSILLGGIPSALAEGLNLSAYPNLQTLTVNTTGFPYAFNFDVSHNTQLKKLDLQLFVLNLDLSQNLLLEDAKIWCPVSNLDFSQNLLLKDAKIWCPVSNIDLTHNQALRILNIKSSSLSSVDLSQNLILESLTLTSSITNLDLRQNQALKLLDFSDNTLSGTNIPNPYLHVIDLRNGHIELINQFLMPLNQPSYCVLVDDVNAAHIVNHSDGIFYYVYSHLTDNASQCALATTQQQNTVVSIYPNPATSKLYFPDGLTFERIIISDLSGKKVMELQDISNGINVESLAKGMYLIRLVNGEKEMFSKFIKS